MSVELVATALGTLMINRRTIKPIGGLGRAQLAWCAANLKGFAWPRVSRLADHERASAAYRIADCIEEARQHVARSV